MTPIRELAEVVGSGATISVLSFCCYLIGSICQVPRVRVRVPQGGPAYSSAKRFAIWGYRLESKVRDWLKLIEDPSREIDVWVDRQIEHVMNQPLNIASMVEEGAISSDFASRVVEQDEHGLLDNADFAKATPDDQKTMIERRRQDLVRKTFVEEVASEFDYLVMRLHIERETLYNDYDRLRSEAEFRFSIFVPLTALVIISAVLWTPYALIAEIITFALLIIGWRKQHLSDGIVWNCLTMGIVESRTIAAIRAWRPNAQHGK